MLTTAAVVGLGVAIAGPAGAASINASSPFVVKTIETSFAELPSSPPVSAVKCPSRKVPLGGDFRCTATIDGQKVPILVQALDTVPPSVKATPTMAVVNVARMEGRIEGQYYARTGVAVSAECPDHGGKAYVVVTPGTPLGCTLTNASGTVGTVTITPTDVREGWSATGLPQ